MSSKKSKKYKLDKNKVVISILAVVIIVFLFVKYNSPSDGQVAAKVNGESIMKEDVLAQYLRIAPELRNSLTVYNILEGMITEELILQEADKAGVSVSEEEVSSSIEDILKIYDIDRNNLSQSLQENNMTLGELEDSFRRQIKINKFLNQTLYSEIDVSEEEMKAYYEENKELFAKPEKVKVSHILVNSSKEAEKVRNMVLGEAIFEDVAEKYSLCPSSERGGNLGWISPGETVPAFEQAAFALKPGQVSDIVETQFGFHIIKVYDKTEKDYMTFGFVDDDIMKYLMQQKKQNALYIYDQQLRKNAVIDIFMNPPEKPQGLPVTQLNKVRNNTP